MGNSKKKSDDVYCEHDHAHAHVVMSVSLLAFISHVNSKNTREEIWTYEIDIRWEE